MREDKGIRNLFWVFHKRLIKTLKNNSTHLNQQLSSNNVWLYIKLNGVRGSPKTTLLYKAKAHKKRLSDNCMLGIRS